MFQDALSNLMPIDWLDPYGRTPFANGSEMSVDITIVETDDGIRAKSVKNPQTAGPSRMMEAIKGALGMGFDPCESPCGSLQTDDQGKQDDKNTKECDTIKPSSSGDSENRDRNPGSQGSPGPSRYGEAEDEDEEKAPGNKS